MQGQRWPLLIPGGGVIFDRTAAKHCSNLTLNWCRKGSLQTTVDRCVCVCVCVMDGPVEQLWFWMSLLGSTSSAWSSTVTHSLFTCLFRPLFVSFFFLLTFSFIHLHLFSLFLPGSRSNKFCLKISNTETGCNCYLYLKFSLNQTFSDLQWKWSCMCWFNQRVTSLLILFFLYLYEFFKGPEDIKLSDEFEKNDVLQIFRFSIQVIASW